MSDIDKLRTVLFETLAGIKDGTIDANKAKSINDVSQTIINSAKAEVDFARVNGSVDTKFFSKPTLPPHPNDVPPLTNNSAPPLIEREVTDVGKGTIERKGPSTIHLIK